MESLKERLDYELSTIESMGYVEYFLIVWDFINYAQKPRHNGRTRQGIGGRQHRGVHPAGSRISIR